MQGWCKPFICKKYNYLWSAINWSTIKQSCRYWTFCLFLCISFTLLYIYVCTEAVASRFAVFEYYINSDTLFIVFSTLLNWLAFCWYMYILFIHFLLLFGILLCNISLVMYQPTVDGHSGYFPIRLLWTFMCTHLLVLTKAAFLLVGIVGRWELAGNAKLPKIILSIYIPIINL